MGPLFPKSTHGMDITLTVTCQKLPMDGNSKPLAGFQNKCQKVHQECRTSCYCTDSKVLPASTWPVQNLGVAHNNRFEVQRETDALRRKTVAKKTTRQSKRMLVRCGWGKRGHTSGT